MADRNEDEDEGAAAARSGVEDGDDFVVPWAHSEARKLLQKDVADGKVPPDLKPRFVWKMRKGQ